jgi:hypothetical protein
MTPDPIKHYVKIVFNQDVVNWLHSGNIGRYGIVVNKHLPSTKHSMLVFYDAEDAITCKLKFTAN